MKDKLRSAYEDLIRAAKSKGGKIGAGVAALGALGAGGYALKRHLDEDEEAEKAAAVDALVNAGLPFEDAAALVKAAAYELDKEASNDDLIAEILANLQG